MIDLSKIDFCAVCGSKKKLVSHHRIPKIEGGNNDETNIVQLCEECHKKIHTIGKRKIRRELGRPNKLGQIAEKLILEKIEENQPVSIYNLQKSVKYLKYSSLHDYITLLEAKGKIKTELKIGENNRAERIVRIKEKENG